MMEFKYASSFVCIIQHQIGAPIYSYSHRYWIKKLYKIIKNQFFDIPELVIWSLPQCKVQHNLLVQFSILINISLLHFSRFRLISISGSKITLVSRLKSFDRILQTDSSMSLIISFSSFMDSLRQAQRALHLMRNCK